MDERRASGRNSHSSNPPSPSKATEADLLAIHPEGPCPITKNRNWRSVAGRSWTNARRYSAAVALLSVLIALTSVLSGAASATPTGAVASSASACRVGTPATVETDPADGPPATMPMVLACVRLGHRTFKMIGYRLRPEKSYLCIETHLQGVSGSSTFCPHSVAGRRPVALSIIGDPMGPFLFMGRVGYRVKKVGARYVQRGKSRHRTAALVRIRDQELLRAIGETHVRYLTLFAGTVPHTVSAFDVMARGAQGELIEIFPFELP